MLPTSKEYLTRAGFSPTIATYMLTGLFLAGIVVISIVSAFMHRFIPSHVVDCGHRHGESVTDPERGEEPMEEREQPNGGTEQTPLLRPAELRSFKSTPAVVQQRLRTADRHATKTPQKEALRTKLTRRISSFVGGGKPLCDEDGPCYGISQTCGRECTKVLMSQTNPSPPGTPNTAARPALMQHQSIAVQLDSEHSAAEVGTHHSQVLPNAPRAGHTDAVSGKQMVQAGASSSGSSQTQTPDYQPVDPFDAANTQTRPRSPKSASGNQHHHHVPQNAFLSIGLQTSLAIALHKLPEGFITFATNHANAQLGMTVFLALFIHNITEGFAMALPLYLALSSRWKAMFWSSLLGGISQPAGAGLAALWIWGSGRQGGNETGLSWGVYGGMFAATAGVMTSVALQLYSEGLSLTHHRGMATGFAVAGMGLIGLSFALTA